MPQGSQRHEVITRVLASQELPEDLYVLEHVDRDDSRVWVCPVDGAFGISIPLEAIGDVEETEWRVATGRKTLWAVRLTFVDDLLADVLGQSRRNVNEDADVAQMQPLPPEIQWHYQMRLWFKAYAAWASGQFGTNAPFPYPLPPDPPSYPVPRPRETERIPDRGQIVRLGLDRLGILFMESSPSS